MKRTTQLFFHSVVRALTLTLITTSYVLAGASTQIVDFEDVALAAENSFITEPFESRGVQFSGQLADFGIYEGFVASNVTVNQDLMVSPGSRFGQPDFELQQYSAYVPENGADSNYGILVLNDSTAPRTRFKGAISAPEGYRFESIDVANTTWAAHSMLIGDTFTDPFADNDSLTLYIMSRRDGISAGEIEFSLAEGTDVVNQFTTISLTSLEDADEILFSLGSTSSSMFGLNTPTFIAIDNLTLAQVPEPGIGSLFALGMIAEVFRRRR